MASCTSRTAACHGRVTAITDLHPDIIQTHILTRLDGPSLASFSSVSSHLRSISTEESLWKTLCNSTWPSTTDARVQEIISTFPSGHRSFYSDSYPTVRRLHHKQQQHLCRRPMSEPTRHESTQTTEVISAVDIHYGNEIIYSKVAVTETWSSWFKSSTLRLDVLNTKEIAPTLAKFDGEEETCMAMMERNLRLSWILIDPVKKRAVNLSSLTPVDVRWQWLTGEMQVRYATVMTAGVGRGFVKCEVDVTCGGEDGGVLQIRDISMQVVDMKRKILNGKDGFRILQDAMDGKRVNGKIGEEKKMYEMFSFWYYNHHRIIKT